MKRLCILLLVVAACGNKKSKGGHDDGDKKTGCQIKATAVADIIKGKTPQLLEPFTAVKLGATRDEAKAACPNLFDEDSDKKTGNFTVGEIVGQFDQTHVYGSFTFANNKLAKVEWKLPPNSVDAFTKAWGAPKEAKGSKAAHAWTDDASGMRAILSTDYDGSKSLAISSYTPLRAFIEPDTKTIAWKPQDVLGKTPAELEKQFPQYVGKDQTSEAVKAKTKEMMADLEKDMKAMGVDPNKNSNDLEVRLPATPLADGTTTHVILHLDDDGTVREYGMWIRTEQLGDYGFPSEPADAVKLLDEIWGPNKKIKDTLGERTSWFDAKRGIRVSAEIDPAKPNELDLGYVRYLPLASFFGEPGPKWGFEKDLSLIGATTDQLTAAFGKRVEIKDDTATLTLPPTDYDGDTSSTRVLMFLEKGKVKRWQTNIPFEDYEPARAEYEALLEAKLGKPKAKGDHFLYGAKPAIDVEYSKYTHELNIEVGN